MMFYSRRIGAMSSSAATPTFIPIIGALKLTGTNRKGLTVGLLESVTAQTSAKVMRNGVRGREVTEPLTNYTVARKQKNWDGNTLLGGMVTAVNRNLTQPHLRDALVANAFTAGVDNTRHFANRLYYLQAKGRKSGRATSREK